MAGMTTSAELARAGVRSRRAGPERLPAHRPAWAGARVGSARAARSGRAATPMPRGRLHTAAVAAPPASDRVFNFSAGPACLPVDVLEEAQADLVNWKGSGLSVMEMSHRGKEFMSIITKAEADLRTLLAIPDNYKVMFLQGGASTQFAALALNLTSSPEDTVDFVTTGSWGKKAVKEAAKFCKVNEVAKGDNKSIPPQSEWTMTPGAKYLHICANETIQGVEFKTLPQTDVPIVADMSSNFLSKPLDISQYGVIYAGAQKNVGPSGVTIVIAREDLIGSARPETPTMLDYGEMSEAASLYNTPPCFSIYMFGLVFEKLLKMGGLEAMEKYNIEKAAVVYDAIKESAGFYSCPVDPAVQSKMNIPFTMSTPELEKAFLAEAAEKGMVQLKGHRSVGGVRASVYNAMPMEGVQALAAFMKEFQEKNS